MSLFYLKQILLTASTKIQMDNPSPGSLRTLIADLLIIAFVIGLLYLETHGVFKFSAQISMIIIGSGIISILLVNYFLLRSNRYK